MPLKIIRIDLYYIEVEWTEFNKGTIYKDVICGKDTRNILQYYANRHSATASVDEWRDKIQRGNVWLNDSQVLDPQTHIPDNSILEYHRAPWKEPDAPCSLEILYVDPHIVAVSKPSGLQVLPAGYTSERCLLTLLNVWYENKGKDILLGPPRPLHRLGKGTSGVLLSGCSVDACRLLSPHFSGHGPIRKIYRALITGKPFPEEGVINFPIGRIDHPVRKGLWSMSSHGKPAKSAYKVLLSNGAQSLVDVEIFSGRPHQIRIHMSSIGHPLVGDPVYKAGGVALDTAMPGDCGYTLHAMNLEFYHPIKHKTMTITAPLPPGLVLTQVLGSNVT